VSNFYDFVRPVPAVFCLGFRSKSELPVFCLKKRFAPAALVGFDLKPQADKIQAAEFPCLSDHLVPVSSGQNQSCW
jgi:hypothetical protein